MRSLQLGDARISIINTGDLGYRLKEMDDVPEMEWKPKYSAVFEQVNRYPSQSVFISIPGRPSILVDAGDYASFSSAASEYAIPDYVPPPSLIDQLISLDVSRDQVNYVLITHAHYDHYAGVTMKTKDGSFVPTFPDAVHLLGREDFENPETQKALSDPSSEDARTLGVLNRMGLLELVEGERVLCDEAKVIASPGETPGHKTLKVSSKGRTLYCVGDLFHHAVEVEHPSWMAKWDDPRTNLKSRNELINLALKEGALIVPSHMPLGELQRTGTGALFIEI